MANHSDREDKILQYMKAEIAKKGYPPTVREICAACGIRSTSTVFSALKSLEERGLIRKDANRRRAVEVLDKDGANKGANAASGPERADVADIPVIGRVAAGQPILAEQNIESYFPLPVQYLAHGKDSFMLIVHGDSMIEVGIYDGDYLLVEQQSTANNGDIVVAMVDEMETGATVKRFFKEQGHIRLQPENSSMSPIIVQDCTIVGKVKGVFRYFD